MSPRFNYDEGYTPETNTPRGRYRDMDDNGLSMNRSGRYRPPTDYDTYDTYDDTYDDTELAEQPAPEPEPRRRPTRTVQQPPQDTPASKPEPRPKERVQPRPEPQPQPRPQPKPQPEPQPRPEPRKKEAKQAPRNVKPAGERRTPGIVRLIRDERMHVCLAGLLLILCVFVVIAVFSHFQHGGDDQSIVVNVPITEAIDNNIDVHNAEGKVGAWVSQVLLCDALGLGSLMLVVYFGILALALLKLVKIRFWDVTFRCLLLAVTISTVLGLVTYDTASTIYWGGNHGHYINKLLIDSSTIIGAVLVSIFLVFCVICVYLNVLKSWWNKSRQKLRDGLERIHSDHERIIKAAQQTVNGPSRKDYVFEDVDEPEPDPEPSPRSKRIHQLAGNIAETITGPFKSKQAGKPDDSLDDEETTVIDNEDNNPDYQGSTGDDNEIIIEGMTVNSAEIEEGTGDIAGHYDPRADLSHYRFPTLDLLEERESGPTIDMEEQQANKRRIEETLRQYNIGISRIEATVGPTVTLYEIVPAEGVRISQIKRLEDDIALSLSAIGIRIIAPIPGKGTVGIEVPNNDPKTVSMYSVINSRKFQECKMALPMAMGATISNDIFIADLAKMPHLLVAGATGMGKSVGLNVILSSLLYKKHPSELKLVLVDPKMVEFSLYSKLERHFLAKLPNQDDAIITDMRNVVETLNSLCIEMDNRYDLLRDANVRSLEEYNKKFTERRLNPDKGHKYLPYIVVVVDEFADLIMTQGKEVETPIARIAQKARAVGIHMILATQRPSTNVITGLIKANFPGRIAFRVIQMVDSRTILDCPGANQLIGRGDMLFSHNGSMERVQCAFMSTEEVERLAQHIDDQVGYEHAYYLPEYVPEEPEGGVIAGASTDRDALFNEAARFLLQKNVGSTSLLQRQFGIGYNRAGKLMDQLEAAGIVGPVNGSKPRNILINDMATLEAILGE